jgi:RNA polymerase sigma factor (sigma-70 family)
MITEERLQKLTEEQQRLVEAHLRLVPFVLHKFAPHLINEDNLQIGYVGLCEAAKDNDTTKGCNFSTFAVTRILWKIRNHDRKRRSDFKEVSVVQYEGEWLEILETVPDKVSVEERALFRYNLSRMSLTDQEKRIIRLLLSGLSTKQVEKWEKLGGRIGTGIPIDRLMGRIRDKWEEVDGTNALEEERRWLLNKERPDYLKEEHLEYLDGLRENTKMNMFDAIPYLIKEFPYLPREKAQEILRYWMMTYQERHKHKGKGTTAARKYKKIG